MLEVKQGAGWLRGCPFSEGLPCQLPRGLPLCLLCRGPSGHWQGGPQAGCMCHLGQLRPDCAKRHTHVLWRKPGCCGRPPHPAGLGLQGGPSCDPYF